MKTPVKEKIDWFKMRLVMSIVQQDFILSKKGSIRITTYLELKDIDLTICSSAEESLKEETLWRENILNFVLSTQGEIWLELEQ